MKNQETISNIQQQQAPLDDSLLKTSEESEENLKIGEELEKIIDEYETEDYYDRNELLNSYLKLDDYLKKHKNSHQFIANKLIELGAGGTIAEHLESFHGLDHVDIANKLIDDGDEDYLVDNFEKFQGLDKTIIDRLIEKYPNGIAYSLEKFPTVNQTNLISKLMAGRNWSAIINNLEKFKDINKEKLLDETIQNGGAEEVAKKLKKLTNINYAVLANKLIDESKEEYVVRNINEFKNLNQEIADKLIAKGKEKVVFNNIDNFENLNKETRDKENIKLREIKQLEEPIEEIIKQMDLEKTNYDAIVGDDASGRIPALIFNEIISKINEEKKIEKPKLLFIAGQFSGVRHEQAEPRTLINVLHKTEEHISKNLKDKKRVLIVTDTINTGNSLISMTESLRVNKIPYDIVSISFLGEGRKNLEEKLKETEKKLGGKIFANLTDVTPRVYRAYGIVGVKKEKANRFSTKIMSNKLDNFEPDEVSRARRDIHILSKKLLEWYKNNKNEFNK